MDILLKQKNHIENNLLLDIVNNFDEESLIEFQNLVAKNKMSSHMLIKAKL